MHPDRPGPWEKQRQREARKAATATVAEKVAAQADSIGGQKPRVTERDKAKVRGEAEQEAKRRAKVDQTSLDQARQAIEDEAKRRPYVIDFYDEPRGPFYKPHWANGGQIAVMINRQHTFFQAFYAPLLGLEGGGQAKQALDVLLIALARAELGIEDDTCAAWYEAQRERAWSTFLFDAYKMLQQTTAPVDEETAEGDVDSDRAGEPDGAWKAVGLDPEGLDLARGDLSARIAFPRRISTPGELRALLAELARDARAQSSENP